MRGLGSEGESEAVIRILRRVVLVVAALFVIGAAGVGWHYSNQILGPDKHPARRGQSVLDHTDSTVTLATSKKALRPGRWAMEWTGGYGEVGEPLGRDQASITRRFRLADGTPPDSTARLAGFAFDANPRTWLGIPYEEIRLPSRVGPLPAWRIARGSTWAIFVHGRAASRSEVLRMLPGYLDRDLTCLVISYRGDDGAPRPVSGYRMGWTEWQDVEDAARFALAHGARDLVVVGCSMGGGIVADFLRHSELRRSVRAAVLDAPALDWEAVFARASKKRGVPAPVTSVGLAVSSLRTGIRWRELTQAAHAREFHTPILIFHGEEDGTVPIAVSERFAAARPDLVTLIRVPAADHVEASNFEFENYRLVLSAWLAAHDIGHARATAIYDSIGPRSRSGAVSAPPSAPAAAP